MRLKTAITFGITGSMLLISKSIISFIFRLSNLEEFGDYLNAVLDFVEIIGFTFVFIFLSRFYKKVSSI